LSEPGERTDRGQEPDRRIARARAAISSSFEELIDRGQRGVSQPPAPPAGPPPPDIEARPGKQSAASSPAVSVEDIVATVEQRVSAWADARVQAAERRLELQSEAYAVALEEAEQRARSLGDGTHEWAGGDADEYLAAIEARLTATEATLRSRLDAAFDQSEGLRDRRLDEQADEHRRRTHEELTRVLQGATAELRRHFDSQQAGARRELAAVARTEIAAAVERLDQLHSATVSESRAAAEAIAAGRLADVQDSHAAALERARVEGRAEIERAIGGFAARIDELFAGFRAEQDAAAVEREGAVRQRAEARVDRIGAELSERIERELARTLAAAEADLERAIAEASARARDEARAGGEAAIAREVAKGEARLVAAAERSELVADEKVAAFVDAAEGRLDDRLAAGMLEARVELEQRLDSLSNDLATGLADEAGKHAAAAVERVRRQAVAEISVRVDGLVAAAVQSARRELERGLAGSARLAVDAESQRIAEELRGALAASAAEQMEAIRNEASRSGYRAHFRRAEAAVADQLARSLDLLKQRRVELSAELADGVVIERERIAGELEEQANALRAEAEAASDRRVAESAAAEFERRSTELEGRVEAMAAASDERIATAAAAVEERLLSADRAQEREERVRERTDAAERQAAGRVREAERRLVEVLARIDAAGQRTV
jgi:hypothetical protein